MFKRKNRLGTFLLVLAALAGLLMTVAFAEGAAAAYVSPFNETIVSLLPPVVAIGL